MSKMIRKTRNWDWNVDDVLGMFGLARRRGIGMFVLPAVGMLAVGVAVGAGIGMMFAPSSGRRMRQRVEDRIGQMRDRFKNTANNVTSNATGS